MSLDLNWDMESVFRLSGGSAFRAGVQRAESSAPHRDEMGRGGSEVNRGGGVECTGGSGHLNEVLSGRRADTATQSLLKEDLFQSDSLGRNEQHAA